MVFWLVGFCPYAFIKYVGSIAVLIHETGIYRWHEEEEQAEGGSEVEVVERSIKGKSKANDEGKKKPHRDEE